MDAGEEITPFELADPEILVKLEKIPSITILFFKIFLLSLVRPSTLKETALLSKARVVFTGVKPDKERILRYQKVCGFSNSDKTIPASYIQTLFIGLLGKFITTPHFPINPMGLIQVGQSFELKRAITIDQTLDLSCRLHGFTKTPKGIQTQFFLEAMAGKEVVWQGISTFFTRSKIKASREKRPRTEEDPFLETKETLFVPRDTGRKYARVSGDYNPHHLYGVTARLLGFKHPIAHGMWSFARVMASMEKAFGTHYPLSANAAFKLPIFMPATITLGYEPVKTPADQTPPDKTRINFELRDAKKGLPHLKGQFAFTAEP